MSIKDLFRLNYTTLNDEQKAMVLAIKTKAEELESLLDRVATEAEGNRQFAQPVTPGPDGIVLVPRRPFENVSVRCLAHGRDRLEEAVMWAVKGVTSGEGQW